MTVWLAELWSPRRQNTIFGRLVVARLSDQPHISVGTQGGHVEECLGRSSIEAGVGCVWIGDVAVRQ